MSLLRLPHEIMKLAVTKPDISKPVLAEAVKKLIEDAEPSWGKVKTWRDKHLAHLDLATSLQEGVTPVEPVTRTIVGDALKAMRGVLNAVQHAFMGSTTIHELRSPWDADALVATLRLGLKFDADRQRRLEQDQELPGDWED